MTDLAAKTERFRKMHTPGAPFIMPNPWDAGSARMLEGLGFQALATTSAGFALTHGRRDYGVTRDKALKHCRLIAQEVDIPVNADLENGFGPTPEDAAETIRLAAETGVAGGSIEDFSGDKDIPIYDFSHAVERIAAAAEAARLAPNGFVLTARAEAFLRGQGDTGAVVKRLNAFAEAGADILFAPGLPDMETVRAICDDVSKPVNVLIFGALAGYSVSEFAAAGAARLSIGDGLAWPAYGTLADAASMLSGGRFDCLGANAAGAKTVAAFLRS